MRRLVVNADDLGADEGRNQGIFEAIERGAVTSVSILANGPGLKDALAEIRRLGKTRGVSCGIHLNLSEGGPLSGALRLLTGPDGRFLGKAATQRLLMRSGDEELEMEVSKETNEQIRRLREAGLTVNHLDGHQHVHVFPAVVRAAMKAAAHHGIPWIRIPDEPHPPGANGLACAAMDEEIRLFSGLAGEARGFLESHSLRAPDRFFGLSWKGRFTETALEAMVRCLPDGLSELMVHPGRIMSQPPTGSFHSFSTSEREHELEILLAPGFRAMLAKEDVELTPFPP
jgi:predicted glycoside hydrolase/deacetylase ChbG (UPF0249 family)